MYLKCFVVPNQITILITTIVITQHERSEMEFTLLHTVHYTTYVVYDSAMIRFIYFLISYSHIFLE